MVNRKTILCASGMVCCATAVVVAIISSRYDSSPKPSAILQVDPSQVLAIQVKLLQNKLDDHEETEYSSLPSEYHDLVVGLINGTHRPIPIPYGATRLCGIRIILADGINIELIVTFYGQGRELTVCDGTHEYIRKGPVTPVHSRYVDESGVLHAMIKSIILDRPGETREYEAMLRQSSQIKKSPGIGSPTP